MSKYKWRLFESGTRTYKENNFYNKHTQYIDIKDNKKFKKGIYQLCYNLEVELGKMNVYDATNFFDYIAKWIEHRNDDFSIKKHPDKNFCDIGKVYSVDFGLGYRNELSNFHRGLCIGVMGDKIGIIPMKSANDKNGKPHSIFKSAYHPNINPNGDKKYYKALKKEGFSKDAVLMIADTRFVSVGKVHKCKDSIDLSPQTFRKIQVQVLYRMMPALAAHYHSLEELEKERNKKYEQETLNRIKNNIKTAETSSQE